MGKEIYDKIMSFSTDELVAEVQSVDRVSRPHRKYVLIDKLMDMIEELRKIDRR